MSGGADAAGPAAGSVCVVVAPIPNPTTLPDVPAFPIAVRDVVIEIRRDPANPGGRLVLQDGVESSYVDLLHPDRLGFEYQRHLAMVVDVAHPRRHALTAFQIGGGPCAVFRALGATRRAFHGTVAEIDPGVLNVAREHLGLADGPDLRLLVGDGRDRLADEAPSSLDLVVVDAFEGIVVPHRLLTTQFTALVGERLVPGGLHIINLIDIPPFGLVRAAVRTLLDAGREVIVLADRMSLDGESSGNFVVAATVGELPAEIIERRAAHDPSPWRMRSGRALRRWVADAAPLDDDIEPVHDLAVLGVLFGRTRRGGGA